jgi:hypothetical protein
MHLVLAHGPGGDVIIFVAISCVLLVFGLPGVAHLLQKDKKYWPAVVVASLGALVAVFLILWMRGGFVLIFGVAPLLYSLFIGALSAASIVAKRRSSH